MAKKYRLLVFLFLSVILSYHLYKPLPSSIEEPWAVRGYLFVLDAALNIARLGETLGIGTFPQNARDIMDFLASHSTNISSPDTLTVTDAVFDGVPVRIFDPSVTKNAATGAFMFYHGGGWIFGSIETYKRKTLALAIKTGIPVVSVGYRLSPEFVYPVPLDDCLKATKYFIKHAKDYNVDPKRIVISGDSAGGNLAAAVALRMNKMKSPILPVAQVLIYPTLQAFDFHLPAFHQNDIFVTRKSLAQVVLTYLGLEKRLLESVLANNHTTAAMKAKYAPVFDVKLLPEKYQESDYKKSVHEGNTEVVNLVQKKITDPFFAPLMAPAELVRGLPSAYILTAGFDALRDDGYFYANLLRKHGVEVKHVDYSKGFHGFLMQLHGPLATQLANQALDDIVDYVKQKVKAK